MEFQEKICEIWKELIQDRKVSQAWRSSMVDSKTIGHAGKDLPKIIALQISSKHDMSQTNVSLHLHQLGKVKTACRECLHELSLEPNIAWKQVVCSTSLQKCHLPKTWNYLCTPNISGQWIYQRQPSRPVARRKQFKKKLWSQFLLEFWRHNFNFCWSLFQKKCSGIWIDDN